MRLAHRPAKARTLCSKKPVGGELKVPLHDNHGVAMVLTISAVALLSLLGVWLVVQSGSTYRITKSVVRRESTFNLAEGALQLSLRCLKTVSSEMLLKNLEKKRDVTPKGEIDYMKEKQPMGAGTLTPRIIFMDSETVPGWDINKFRGYYYIAQGDGNQALPLQKGGDSRSEVLVFIEKIGQVRSR